MGIDRVATLRSAAQCLRQGKLDEAIEEYLRVVDDQPHDWNTANLLGDLYVRAGQTDKAVAQFTRIADSLRRDGFLPKAGALFKKILKIRPQDEHALMMAAEIAETQGLLVDARAYVNAVCEQRRIRGDAAGVVDAMIRLAGLDPDDHPARFASAKTRLEVHDVEGAVSEFEQLAVDLAEQGRTDEALAALKEAAECAPVESTGSQPFEPPELVRPPHSTEIDLTIVLDEIKASSRLPQPLPKDIDDVFAQLRGEASARLSVGGAEQHLLQGMTLYESGNLEGALPLLEAAARAPRYRFEAASALGRIFLERGQTWAAIEWMERAAEAPAPTPQDGHQLLFELADVLEAVGEVARALAICLELRAEAGEYQDVAMRVDRLSKVQARG